MVLEKQEKQQLERDSSFYFMLRALLLSVKTRTSQKGKRSSFIRGNKQVVPEACGEENE
jgi:hypothetical protein